MRLEEAATLVDLLRSGLLRTRTGILLLAPALLGQESEVAARLRVDAADYADVLLTGMPPGARTLGISAQREARRLDALAVRDQGADTLLVSNFDLALSRMAAGERERLWDELFVLFSHRQRALLLSVPEPARDLLPAAGRLQEWKRGGRLATVDIRE